ncbi:MAG: c-type cytochrome domain-containing protein, partial [Planctomycetia bacterium]
MTPLAARLRILVAAAAVGLSAAGPAAADEPPSFARDVNPLRSNRCLRCHGPAEEGRQAGLRVDTFEGATADLGGHAAIVPGNPAASAVIDRIGSTDPDHVMPPPEAGDPLTPAQIDLL